MKIYFYNNTKRLNSTKQAPEYIEEKECYLKDNTSFLMPTLKLHSESKPNYNYFKFEDRYYYVTDIVSVNNNLWEVTGSIDPMTTFRGHIFNTQAFVLYDSTPNDQLPDNRLAIETDCEVETASANMPWGFSTDSTAGTYFVATTGESDILDIDFDVSLGQPLTCNFTSDGRAGTGVYAIPQNSIKEIGFDFSDFVDALIDILDTADTDFTAYKNQIAYIMAHPDPNPFVDFSKLMAVAGNITIDVTTEYPTRLALLIMQNIIGGGNALQNVKASYWLPFNIPGSALEDPGTGGRLALGTYTDIVPGIMRVTKPVITAVNIDVAIPWKFDDWRNVACTEIMLYIPLIGCVSIPPEVVKGNDTLQLKFSLNIYSGDLACEILCDGAEIGTYGANSAMNILIGDSNINTGGLVNTVIAGVTHNYAGLAGGVADTLTGMNTSVGGIGGGAGTGLTDHIVCVVRTHNTSQEPAVLLPVIGTPTRQLKTLSQGLGYCQTLNAQLNCSAVVGEPNPTQTEIQMINDMLNGGCYLE